MIQYYHDITNYRTVAALVDFTRSDLENIVLKDIQKELVVKMGFTFVHPEDTYSKKIGREVSKSKMQNYIVKFNQLTFDGSHLFYHFKNNDITLTFKVSHKSDKPHFIHGLVYTHLF